jgi:hypothetical protein
MSIAQRAAFLVLPALVSAGALLAQAPPIRQALGNACGVQKQEDGTLRGAGPTYMVQFDANGCTYVPLLGKQAPRALPLTLTALGAGRDAAGQPFPVAGPNLVAGANQVVFARGTCDEVYTLRADGVKQDFVFHQLPAGRGDLVVACRVTTELVVGPGAGGDVAMAFTWGDLGGVTIGHVLGVDARGDTCRGELRHLGDRLEFVLPAAFVDAAVLPLTLDPLVGTALLLGTSVPNNDANPDLAWDDTNNCWLAVWTRSAAGNTSDVVAQRLDQDGNVQGSLLAVEGVANVAATRPRVANLNASNRFVVVWQESNRVKIRAVDAANGNLSSTLTVATGADTLQTPVVAGDQSTTLDDAIVVWDNATDDTIDGVRVEAASNGGFTLIGSPVVLVPVGPDDNTGLPAISRSGGSTGHYALVWHHTTTGLVVDEIAGCVIDRSLAVVRPQRTITALVSGNGRDANADVDGDGRQWVVTYPLLESAAATTHDVWAVGWRSTPNGTSLTTPVRLENGVGDDEFNPTVAWLGESALVAYADAAATGVDVDLRSIDPFTCGVCEGLALVDAGGNDPVMRVGSRFAAGEAGDEAAILFAQDTGTTFGSRDVYWQRWDGEDGRTTQVGSGCGNGGTAYAPCARVGNANFALHLRSATPAASAFVVIGPRTGSMGSIACGPCTLVPDFATGFVDFVGTTDAGGDAVSALAIPADPQLVGRSLLFQFVVAGNACTLGLDLSSAVRFTIE